MNGLLTRRIGLAALLTAALYIGVPFTRQSNQQGARATTTLQAPALMENAYAAADGDVLQRIDEEAGISAYFKAPDAITLSQVRTVYRTIELETSDYILGSVAVPNYPEHYDVHVYVHKTGWILAYYLRPDPVSKMLDMLATTINTTKLKTVVAAVAGAAGAPFGDVTYYDFRYPSATHMLLVAEDNANGNDFTIKLPSNYGYFDRGWGLRYLGSGDAYFAVNGVRQTAVRWENYGYGTLNASQLLPDITYSISIADYGILVIIYRVP